MVSRLGFLLQCVVFFVHFIGVLHKAYFFVKV